MEIPFYIVDAFTDVIFSGNPAAVCVLDSWLDNRTMQKIARENNLSETAFFVGKDGRFDLKWFTPEVEIDLCGHATLASAFVINRFIDPACMRMDFKTLSGILIVTREENIFTMEFPARKPKVIDWIENLSAALGREPDEIYIARDILAVFGDETIIRELKPDFEIMKKVIPGFGIIVSAPGSKADFVSRFFAPKAGIPEDPVTGSSHSTLIPFWAERLNKSRLTSYQVSERFGELFCENAGEKVKISGQAVLYSSGKIYL